VTVIDLPETLRARLTGRRKQKDEMKGMIAGWWCASGAARNVDQPGIARRDSVRLSAFGLALGLPVGVLAVHSLIAGDDMRDASTAAVAESAAIGILLVATAAVWIPARRAPAIDPAVAPRRQSPPGQPLSAAASGGRCAPSAPSTRVPARSRVARLPSGRAPCGRRARPRGCLRR
jgi:hypothetical protein